MPTRLDFKHKLIRSVSEKLKKIENILLCNFKRLLSHARVIIF